MNELENLKKRLDKIEQQLSSCRTSAMQDGWQTQRYAKKSRKWDVLAQRKMAIIAKIDEIEFAKNIT